MTDRIDDLLAEALATGAIPDGATADERAELAPLLAAARDLVGEAAQVREESAAALPVARARFERYLERQQTPAPAPAKAGAWRFGSWLRDDRMVRAIPAIAAVVALVAAGLFILPTLTDDVETASAQVLVPGEYVQFEAVAGDADDEGFSAGATFGDVKVLLDEDTDVVDESGIAAGVEPGRAIVVGGTVGEDGRVRARTVAVSDERADRPSHRPARPFERFRELDGRVVAIALGDDGEPRVVIEADGELVVVPVDAPSLEALLQHVESAVGSQVMVVRSEDGDRPVFGLRRQEQPSSGETPGGPPRRDGVRLPTLSGVVGGFAGGVLTVTTEDGEREVQLTRRTQFRMASPDLDREAIAGGRIIGRSVTVVVSRGPGDVAIADTVIVGGLR